MNFYERMQAVLHGGRPDKVPFAPYDNLVPRGAFARELENRGMGLCFRRSTIWSDSPNVMVQTHTEGDLRITSYVTLKGTVTTAQRLNLGRISDSGSIGLDGMIKVCLAAVCDPVPGRAAAAKEKYGCWPPTSGTKTCWLTPTWMQ